MIGEHRTSRRFSATWPFVNQSRDFTRRAGDVPRRPGYCDRHEMPLLVTQADYNIAYRTTCAVNIPGRWSCTAPPGSTASAWATPITARSATWMLEMYLELNLCDEAAELADVRAHSSPRYGWCTSRRRP